jgi:hypothetical protein
MVRKTDFDGSVPLPPGLSVGEIRRAIEFIEREAADFIDVYFEQSNIFSALIGILGIKALDTLSSYEKHRHRDLAQQRFPDLRRRGSGSHPAPSESLESKASKRPWAIQSHYDHPGWYIVWRYLVDETETLESERPVIVWRVDVVFLEKDDWKYETSGAGTEGGGRTHTFGVKNPATKLKGKAVYLRADVVVKNGKPVPKNGDTQ